MDKPSYLYKAVVRSVYDGDTIRVDVDLGMDIWQHDISLRLYGINAPEVRGDERPQGLVSRDWLRDQLPVGTEIVVETIKDKKGKYGRYLAVLWLEGVDLNRKMVDEGLANDYMI